MGTTHLLVSPGGLGSKPSVERKNKRSMRPKKEPNLTPAYNHASCSSPSLKQGFGGKIGRCWVSFSKTNFGLQTRTAHHLSNISTIHSEVPNWGRTLQGSGQTKKRLRRKLQRYLKVGFSLCQIKTLIYLVIASHTLLSN